MGKLIWHEWARLLALTAAIYMLWASLWAFFYRKFFWDFVGSELGPTGGIPDSTSKAFNKITIEVPILQLFTLISSIGTIALEYPLPQIKGTMIHRSQIARITIYLTAAFAGFLVYQTFDCALYFVIAALAYTRSLIKKEMIGPDLNSEKGQSPA